MCNESTLQGITEKVYLVLIQDQETMHSTFTSEIFIPFYFNFFKRSLNFKGKKKGDIMSQRDSSIIAS